MLRVPARRCRHLHPRPHHRSTLRLRGSPVGSCGATAEPCEQGQVKSRAQASSDLGNSWVLCREVTTTPVLLLAARPAQGIPRAGASKGRAGSAGAAAAQGLGCEQACQDKGKPACALKLFFPFLFEQKTDVPKAQKIIKRTRVTLL